MIFSVTERRAELLAIDERRRQIAAQARKTAAVEGPSCGMEPGPAGPEQYDRGYIEAGHAVCSPQSGPPTVNPLPMVHHYVPPGEPRASAIPAGAIARCTSGSPSDR
jgi:hypothetical protein